jgi:hypothetical protein
MEERVLTEFRVLVFYLKQIALPSIGALGLHHDDFTISRSLFTPISTLFSALSIFASVLFAFFSLKRFAIIAFGILFFYSAHLIESTFIGLELVHEHRNYLASFGIVLMMVWTGFQVYIWSNTKLKKYLLILTCISIFWVLGSTALRAFNWSDPSVHALYELENHPNSPRSNYRVGRLYVTYASSLESKEQKRKALNKAAYYFEKSTIHSQAYTDGLFALFLMEVLDGVRMPAPLYQELLRRLEFEAFNLNNYNYLHSLLSCVELGDCNVDKRRLSAIKQASARNAGFGGKAAKQVLERFGRL